MFKIFCQHEKDAGRIRVALGKRLAKDGLQLNERKTHRVYFSKHGCYRGQKTGGFDFLGLTFFLGRSRQGSIIPKFKTSGQRRRDQLKNLSGWVARVRNRIPLKHIWALFSARLRGHIQYDGVSFNGRAIKGFMHQATRILFRQLNRRSQRQSFIWEQFQRFTRIYPLPPILLRHALY